MTKEVLTLTRPISIPELKSALVEAFNEALEKKVTPLEEEIRNLRDQIENLTLTKEDLDELKAEIHNINENQLDLETLREALKRKSFWDIFKKPGIS